MWDVVDAAGNQYNISLGGALDDLKMGGDNLVAKYNGKTTFTLDLSKYPYTMTEAGPAPTELYIIGGYQGWSHDAAHSTIKGENGVLTGYFYVPHAESKEFKFCTDLNWDGINYGMTDGVISTDGGAGNINAGANGLYWCQVNTAELTYSLYLAETLGVIGDATPGAWDNSTALTPSADFLVWTGDVEFKAGGEWKLRANNAWDVNLGGDMNNLSKDGSNIATPGEGVYTVTLDLSKLPYTVSVAKK